jgi:hypothetical protein
MVKAVKGYEYTISHPRRSMVFGDGDYVAHRAFEAGADRHPFKCRESIANAMNADE